MAQRSRWLRTLADFFKKNISREVQMLQRYLELARKCMKHAMEMTSLSASKSLRFNRGQCIHLANELEEAVQTANDCASIYSSNITAETVGIVKLLCWCAKEVENFIQSCRHDKWVQAAVVLSNVSAHVSSLSFELKFCTLLLRQNTILKAATWQELVELNFLKVESELFNEIVKRDQRALLSKLEDINQPANSSDEEHQQRALLSRLEARYQSTSSSDGEHQLVRYLSGRLNQHISGSVQSNVWEIDFSSLKQVHRLENGSVGTVRKSTWLGAEVAEKRFYGADHPFFRNEVEILARLAHPNIVPLLGYAMDESKCSIVMELMDGDLLFLIEERSQQNPNWDFPFTTSEAVDMMLQTAEGMLYLHDNRVVHRDLKSQNILVKIRRGIDAEYMQLKVSDFGLSKIKERSSSHYNWTSNTGTTRWMAPELIIQVEDHRRVMLRYPFKVDVYSFGMVCYEIMTGKLPFSSISSMAEIKSLVLRGERPKLPDECLPDVKILIASCWNPEAHLRPSFVEICKRLRCVKYLLMRGSSVTIDAHWLEHKDMKEREDQQKEKEEREAIALEKERAKREAVANQQKQKGVQLSGTARSISAVHRRAVGSPWEATCSTWPRRQQSGNTGQARVAQGDRVAVGPHWTNPC